MDVVLNWRKEKKNPGRKIGRGGGVSDVVGGGREMPGASLLKNWWGGRAY